MKPEKAIYFEHLCFFAANFDYNNFIKSFLNYFEEKFKYSFLEINNSTINYKIKNKSHIINFKLDKLTLNKFPKLKKNIQI